MQRVVFRFVYLVFILRIHYKQVNYFPFIYALHRLQIVNGDLRGISQASVSRIVSRVSKMLASYSSRYINFSTEQKRRSDKNKFHDIANFPSVIGCIDCTHIRIANPGGNNGEVFRNRKGWFSLNVQV